MFQFFLELVHLQLQFILLLKHFPQVLLSVAWLVVVWHL